MAGDRLTVCMYCPTASGGHPLYARELLTALADLGRDRDVAVELVTARDLDDEHRVADYPIRDILPAKAPRRAFASTAAWAMSRLAYFPRRERAFLDWVTSRPDLGLIHFQDCCPPLAPAHFRRLRRRGLALVFTVHNIRLHFYKNALHQVVRDTSMRSAWRACHALLVHTEGLRRDLAEFLGTGHPPIHVVPHGVWSVAGRVPGRTVNRRPRLLFFGAIRPNKGLHVLLRAMQDLPECDLTVAGPSEDARYLGAARELALRLPPGRVELIDRYVSEDEMAGLFARSDLLMLPYTSFAAQSGVLYQALAHGVPVVATDVGGLGESIRQWGIGEVVPPGDERALAGAVGRMLDPARHRAAVEAIDRARDEMTWTASARATLDVYRSLVPQGVMPAGAP